jgi:Zn-dependent protease
MIGPRAGSRSAHTLDDIGNTIRLLSAAAIPVLFAIACHEAAHGYAARLCGDSTAEMMGRVTLNPLRHIDPVGTILMPILLGLLAGMPFGWAKPVPVDPRNFRRPRRDAIAVAAAGPGANFAMAVGWAVVLLVLTQSGILPGEARPFFLLMAQFGIQFNVLLGVFNLLPIPPLDGARVLRGVVPNSVGGVLDRIEPYGLIIVMGLLAVGLLGRVLAPVVGAITELIYSLIGG